MNTLFEQNGCNYEIQGDYQLPCIATKKQNELYIGVWANRHRQYLKLHHRIRYYNLLTSERLYPYLADIEEQAQVMFSQLVKSLAEKENVTEKLKADNPMLWVRKMNNIRNRAMEVVNVVDPKAELANYVRLGGFPATHLQAYSQDEVYTIVRDIYNSTIFSDIVKRNQVRKIDQLERVVKYTFNNVGNTFSAKSISDYLKAEHRALDNETVCSYLEKLEKAYLLHRCSRFDLQGKEILKTQEKFYLADTALRYSVLGYNADSVASSLENVVYFELCRRGYTVNVGKSGSGEIDFVAVRQNEKLYVQVTQELRSPKTEKREYERLLEIHDNYPKYVLTTDEFSGGNYEGIKTMHIADFLLSSEY